MAGNTDISYSLQEHITQLLKPQKIRLMRHVQLNQPKGKAECRVLVMTLWRAYVVHSKQPVRVESSFSYLEIYAISIESLNQVVIETDRQTYSLSLTSVEDLEAMVSHVTASLKKIFPDSSPGKILKKIPPDLQERLWNLATRVEEHLTVTLGPCGGFSETYAALCDFNEFPCREEVQWDVDNIYYVQNCREFNLLDFSHLENRDLALSVAALSFNQWFTKISSKDLKLSAEVQEQVLFMINRSSTLEEVCLEGSGLKLDFAVKMACALRDHTRSAIHTINLSANHIEDKGVIALSQELENLPNGLTQLSLSRISVSPKGLGSLAQAFSQNKAFSSSLCHLDLSGNTGSLATEEAVNLFKFLSGTNAVSYLDLSGTDCPLDALFVSLSAGCCSKLAHLNLSRNPFSHRKAREVTRTVKEVFSKSNELRYVGLAGTKLPPEALRLLLQGLATNTHLCGLELDLSGCELRSAGAQVIQEHIFEAKAISSLDLSDNGFESDMVTLVLSIGRSHSIRHLALGRNFTMKSRALTDVLQRIVQLIQEEECPLESLSVCDSKLKTGTTILINSLGSNASLTKIDISGNCIGDTGAKMLAKALLINTKLRTLVWDRNNVTAKGFLDVANALERNFTLQHISIPMNDVTHGYRNSPEKTEEALQKIQACLIRNSQRQSGGPDQILNLQQGLKTVRSEQMVQGLCQRLQESVRPLAPCNIQEVQSDILAAEEVLHNAKTSITLLPSLYELGKTPSSGAMLQHILNDTAKTVTNEITEEIQELAQALLQSAQTLCPRVTHRSSVCEQLADCVAKKSRQTALFIQDTFMQHIGELISNKLSELKLSVSVSLVESIVDEVLQDLSVAQQKLDRHMREQTSSGLKTNVPHLRVVDHDFPMDDYVPVIWRRSFHSKSIRPAPSVKSLLDVDTEQQARESMHYQQEGAGVGGKVRALSSTTTLSVTVVGQLKPEGPSHTGREADAAAAAALSNSEPRRPEPAPPQPPMDLPIDGHTLRHYTRSRPRPNRRNSKPPTKPQEQAAESEENEANETIGRVDEGVEEFFTKKIIPDDPLKAQREEIPDKAQPTESTSTTPAPPSTPAPAPPSTTTTTSSSTSSSSTTVTTTPSSAPSKKIKKRFGDFFAFKKGRAGQGAKGEVKKTSIADLIRPLREAKEKEKEREREKKGKLEEESGAKATSVNDSDATTTVRAAEDNTMAPATPSEVPTASLPTSAHAQEEVSPSPVISPIGGFLTEKEKSRTPDGERRLKATRRTLRDGKSQSLILLTGLEDGTATHGKKHASESTSSLEQRLHVMLHRMGVAKTPPADTKTSQNKEEELRKANSEGAILDKKTEPPPTFMKPRTMSTSASDTRRPIRAGVTPLEAIRTDKPLLPGRHIGPLPPKPTVAAKPPLPAPQQHPAAARTSLGFPQQPSKATGPENQPTKPEPSQTHPQQREPPCPSPRKETPPAPSPRRGPSALESRERSERAQSVTEESLPKPRPRMKPSPQRRAVSVYEDSLLREHAALLDPEELKAALPRLQRSPVQKRANLGELPTCSEDQPEGKEAGEAEEKERTGEGEEMDSWPVTEDKPGPSPVGASQGESTAEKRGETVSQQHTAQAETSDQRTEPPLPETHMD
ncbi:capping protein, Arp2/3 and myosin-I linker protein 2 [Coregonus clupeaformis]|uniref:capping protein, Arp2/3 and myosin-I linker protein 2 n=1 Tax=Coregonus clupeaformis TaxID=59861 RepID=UPI001BE100ED|nr:capping protein, Arp2/3 and myosin-I linker protein 2 [Coregonus clupeaformis]